MRTPRLSLSAPFVTVNNPLVHIKKVGLYAKISFTFSRTRHCVGVRPLLCRHRGCELEIPLYHTHRFLNPDTLCLTAAAWLSAKQVSMPPLRQ